MFDIKKEVAALENELELGYQEFLTSKKICGYLTALGLEDIQTITKTGVTALLKGTKGEGKTIMLRADMDALPVEEMTGLPFASQNKGVMHACGHDSHMAIQLIVAKILATHKDEFSGTVKFVFQPNEEEAGALNMIEAGVLENPHVDAALASVYLKDRFLAQQKNLNWRSSEKQGTLPLLIQPKMQFWALAVSYRHCRCLAPENLIHCCLLQLCLVISKVEQQEILLPIL